MLLSESFMLYHDMTICRETQMSIVSMPTLAAAHGMGTETQQNATKMCCLFFFEDKERRCEIWGAL